MKNITLNGISNRLASKNRNKTIAIAIIMLFTLSAIVSLPNSSGKTYTAVPDRDTGTVVGVSPTLAGLGQEVMINIMTYPAPSGPTLYIQDVLNELTGGLGNISCTITSPDGTKNTFMPIDMTIAHAGISIPGQAQIVGSLQFMYKPSQVGNYSVTASFPGQTYTTDRIYENMNLSVYYKPSTSVNSATFTIQADQVLSGLLNGYPWQQLPQAYWADPVLTNNREWAAISGDWTQSGYDPTGSKWNPYSTAPNAPHIIWSMEVGKGGLGGGDLGSLPYAGQGAPMGGAGSIIIDGKIYQNDANGATFQCTDLRTGQILWRAPGQVNLAQRLDVAFQTEAQQNEGGVSVFLWGLYSTNWTRYDVFDGHVLQTITGVPSGSISYKFFDSDPVVWLTNYGNWNTTLPLKYAYENLIKWNFEKMIQTKGFAQSYSSNWKDGIVWNVSIRQPDGVGVNDGRTGNITPLPYPGANVVLVKAHNDENIIMAFDMTTGNYLYRANTAIDLFSTSAGFSGPYVVCDGASQNYIAYNVKTGKEQWRATLGQLPWAMIPASNFVTNTIDRIFHYASYDGHVYAVDTDTGAAIWTSDYVGKEDESIYGNQPFNGGSAGADGKVYYSTSTTYSLMPRTRFHELVCINESTGNFIWKLPMDITPRAIVDGYLLTTDTENGIQYCIGKGQTSTTVTTLQAQGGMLIQGSVMDMSPGNPNTPAISDSDMGVWMDYLYGQNATLINSPPTPKGVTVQLNAVDPNGNAIDLGTTTSDSSGHFAIGYTPTTTGLYTIYATFGGSNSYWSSYGETSWYVGTASAASPTPIASSSVSLVTNSDLAMYVIAAAIAMIIAVALATILILRKK